MHIQLLSDLHIDHHRDYGKLFANKLDSTNVDVLVIAGDTVELRSINEVIPFYKIICDKYPLVLEVLGNHSFYNSSPAKVDEYRNELRNKFSNLHILDNEVYTINDQSFVGSTLWFPDNPTNVLHEKYMNDFIVIKNFKPWVYDKNKACVDFISDNLNEGDVLITHHMPSPKCVASKYRNNELNRFFVCDIEKTILEKKPKVALFGHTHHQMDFNIGDVRFVCNSYGYPGEPTREDFDPKLIINI